MWKLRVPKSDERRNSASDAELRKAQQLVQIIEDSRNSNNLRRTNSFENDPSRQNKSFLKVPTSFAKNFEKYYGAGKRRGSSFDPRDFKSVDSVKSSPKLDRKFFTSPKSQKNSPVSSPKLPRANERRGSSTSPFVFANQSKPPRKDISEKRPIKDLRANDSIDKDGKRSRGNSLVPTLESNGTTAETTMLVSESNNSFQMNYSSFDYVYKILVVGDSGVGKTCFVTKFRDDVFLSGTYIPSIGTDLRNKTVMIRGKKIQVQMLDAAGQERFRHISRNHYNEVQGIVLLYDTHYRSSFSSIQNWMMDIRKMVRPNTVILLVGNKCDLPESERSVSKDEGDDLAKSLGIPFLEASAKSGKNVETVFTAVVRQLRANQSYDPSERKFSISTYIQNMESQTGVDKICGECRLF